MRVKNFSGKQVSGRRAWEPMRLSYLGRVDTLMRGSTGTRQDTGNTCVTRKPTGSTCP